MWRIRSVDLRVWVTQYRMVYASELARTMYTSPVTREQVIVLLVPVWMRSTGLARVVHNEGNGDSRRGPVARPPGCPHDAARLRSRVAEGTGRWRGGFGCSARATPPS